MKAILKLFAVITVGAFLFTACEQDVTLSVPGDTTIDLGEDFDPKEGVDVSGADLEDVTVLWNPEFDNTVVNHYVASYTVNGETATRNIYVSADELAGSYVVVDEEDDWSSDEYTVNVVSIGEYNELRFDQWLYEDISLIEGRVEGEEVIIPNQEVYDDLFVEGTGTYDGAEQKILTIDYKIEDEGTVYEGTSTFQ